MKGLFIVATTASITALVLILYFIFSEALPNINKIGFIDFISGTKLKPTSADPKYGILPMIVASIYATIGTIVIGIPIGVFAAIYMAFYAPKNFYTLLKLAKG